MENKTHLKNYISTPKADKIHNDFVNAIKELLNNHSAKDVKNIHCIQSTKDVFYFRSNSNLSIQFNIKHNLNNNEYTRLMSDSKIIYYYFSYIAQEQ